VRLYLDSSAMVKMYVPEAGSELVKARCGAADEILVSVLVRPETVAALTRLLRAGKLTQEQYDSAKQSLNAALEVATVIELSPSVVGKAVACLEAHPIRTLDAIHVASALENTPDRFLSADKRQCATARAMGLNVEEITP
jgi:predicted nucleic acid-binding protein